MTIQQNIDAFLQATGALVKTIRTTRESEIEKAFALIGNFCRNRLPVDSASTATAVVTDVQVQPDGDSLRLQLTMQLPGDETGNGTSFVHHSLQLATSSQPGLMPADSFSQIQTNTAAIAALEEASVGKSLAPQATNFIDATVPTAIAVAQANPGKKVVVWFDNV